MPGKNGHIKSRYSSRPSVDPVLKLTEHEFFPRRHSPPVFLPQPKMPFGTGPSWSILRPHHPQYPLPAPPGSPWGNILTPQAPPSTRTPTSGPLWTSFRAKKHEISRNHPTSPHGTHGTILGNQVLRAFGAPYGTNEGTEYWVLLHLASHRPRLLGRRSSGRRRAAKHERNEYTRARGAPSALIQAEVSVPMG